jgi:glycosyltransferase involved in cell wall biosynthesis
MNQSRRIAIVTTSALSLNVLMRGQLEFLRSKGADLDFYVGGPDDELLTLRKRKVGRVQKVPFRRKPHPFWDFICLASLTAFFSVRRYDAVIYSTPKAMFLGSLAAFLTRQPRRIAMVRGRGYENFEGRKRQIYIALDRLTFRVSHEVLFISRSLMAAYEADGLNLGSRGRILGFGSSNGVDSERFRPLSEPERSALRSQLGLSSDDFVIVVVGRIRTDKGASEVLNLARRLRDIRKLRILTVGRIEEEALRAEVESADREQVRRFASSSEVEKFFQAADLHLFLSHREGFGNVAIEAAAAGVPTFGFDVVGVRDSVIHGVSGHLFQFADLDAIEAAIRLAVDDPKSLAREYPHAREAVSKRFSQPRVWRRYAEVFLQ